MYSDHITEGNQDIFLLRVKKKAEYSEQKDRNVELELRTPKPPPIPPPTPVSAVTPQTVADIDVVDEKNMVEEVPKQPINANERKSKRKKKGI